MNDEAAKQVVAEIRKVIESQPSEIQTQVAAARSALLSTMYAHPKAGVIALSLIGAELAAGEIKP